jgi:hypothetical protein
MYRVAAKAETAVTDQRPGEKVRLAEDLKTVADPEHGAARGSEGTYSLHDRAEPGYGSCTQVITVGESAWQHDYIRSEERFLLVPQDDRLLSEARANSSLAVEVAVRSGEADDPEFHPAASGWPASSETVNSKSSITGFASRRSQASRTCCSQLVRSAASILSPMVRPIRTSWIPS